MVGAQSYSTYQLKAPVHTNLEPLYLKLVVLLKGLKALLLEAGFAWGVDGDVQSFARLLDYNSRMMSTLAVI